MSLGTRNKLNQFVKSRIVVVYTQLTICWWADLQDCAPTDVFMRLQQPNRNTLLRVLHESHRWNNNMWI